MLALFFSFTSVYGQQLKVKGTVTGDGSLLPGVTVAVKGQQVGSVTDFDGNFEISANKDDVLVFSYIGFKTLEITAIESSMEINLSSDVSKLDEVVVVGYGSSHNELHGCFGQFYRRFAKPVFLELFWQ